MAFAETIINNNIKTWSWLISIETKINTDFNIWIKESDKRNVKNIVSKLKTLTFKNI